MTRPANRSTARRGLALVAAGVCLLTACSDGRGVDGDVDGAVDAPVTTTASTPATSPTVPPTPTPPTSVPPTTVPMQPMTGVVLPPDLGHLVPSAPGVSAPGDIWELAPKLWLFLPADSAGDPHLTPPGPDDAEIIIAYARKQKALNLAVSRFPMALDAPELQATYTASGIAVRQRALEPMAKARLELADGLVFRPRVASEPRSADRALIVDCLLDTTYFVDAASGAVWPGQPSGRRTTGVFAELVHSDGRWVVDRDGPEDFSCV